MAVSATASAMARPSPSPDAAEDRRAQAADLPADLPTDLPLWMRPGVHEIFGQTSDSQLAGWAMAWTDATPAQRQRGWVWIGPRAWPGAEVLRRAGLLTQSLWVRASHVKQIAQAAEIACTCDAVGTIVADGSGMDLRMTRRLQLATRDARQCRLLLLRPGRDRSLLSAAQIRWHVEPVPVAMQASADSLDAPVAPRNPRWRISLVRSKGAVGASPQKSQLSCGSPASSAAELRLVGEQRETDELDQASTARRAVSSELRSSFLSFNAVDSSPFSTLLDPDDPPAWILEWDPTLAACRIVQSPSRHATKPASIDPGLHPRWPAEGLPVGLPADVAGGSAVATVA